MNLWDVYKELESLAHVYRWDTPIRTGGVEGDEITAVWYDASVPAIYIH